MTTGSPVTLTASGQAAGSGTLHAIYKGVEATAQLTVVVERRRESAPACRRRRCRP